MTTTQVSLTVVKTDDTADGSPGNNSTTSIQTDSLEELARMLHLAGVKAPGSGMASAVVPVRGIPVSLPVDDTADNDTGIPDESGDAGMGDFGDFGGEGITDESAEFDYGSHEGSRQGSVYDMESRTHHEQPSTHQVPARSGDNPLDESDGDRSLADTYHGHRKEADHDEAVARTADEHGVPGEHVVKAVKKHKAYEGIAKGFADYLREVQASKEVDEAYGASHNRRTGKTTYHPNAMALLPIPANDGGMVNLDGLGDNEYARMNQPNEGIVVLAIEVGGGKTRLTYASSAGNVEARYKPGTEVLTYHDQSGAERPGKILYAFDSNRYQSPEGRQEIAHKLQSVGMDAKKKYSLRVFK